MIQAVLANRCIGDTTIPVGSMLEGTVTDASAGKMLERSGSLGIKLIGLERQTSRNAISAHIVAASANSNMAKMNQR